MDEGEQVVNQESPSGSISEAPVVTPEAIREYLKTHLEELEPEVSRRVDQGISKINERRRKEEQEREAHRAEDRQIQAYVESVPEEQRWRLDPRVLDRYHKAQISQNAGPDYENEVNRRLEAKFQEVWGKAKAHLQEHPDFGADIVEDWDSLDAMEFPSAIAAIAGGKVSKEKKRMDEEVKKEIANQVAKLRAELHLVGQEADVIPGAAGVPANSAVRERYRTGTAQDRAELRKEYGERLDDILNG